MGGMVGAQLLIAHVAFLGEASCPARPTRTHEQLPNLLPPTRLALGVLTLSASYGPLVQYQSCWGEEHYAYLALRLCQSREEAGCDTRGSVYCPAADRGSACAPKAFAIQYSRKSTCGP